jgi:hypothetical protein
VNKDTTDSPEPIETPQIGLKSHKRQVLSYDPHGPIRGMLVREIASRRRANSRAPVRTLFDDMVIAYLGPKYPKLLDRYNALGVEA